MEEINKAYATFEERDRIASLGGGVDKIEKQHESGKMTARERDVYKRQLLHYIYRDRFFYESAFLHAFQLANRQSLPHQSTVCHRCG